MMQKKKYVCIFPGMLNYHLIKDVGLLPYAMGRFYNYDSNILTYNNDEYTLLDDELKGGYLKLIYLDKVFNKETRDVVWYLLKNSGSIDVLQSFNLHDTLGLFAYFSIFKLLNRSGKVYVKLDADDLIISLILSKKGVYGYMQRYMIRHLIDVMSVESSNSHKKLTESGMIPSDKLVLVPNGICIQSDIKISKKANCILTVGHLGTRAKATEVLMEAFSKIKDPRDWKLILLGSVEESFREYIENYFQENPHLKDKVIFKGYVSDREEIYRYYANSRIFCFPSRTESFGIALVEAAYFGNYLLTTDVGGARDVLNVTNYGEIIKMDDSDYLARRIQEFISNDANNRDPDELMSLVDNSFNWAKLCGRIHAKLSQK